MEGIGGSIVNGAIGALGTLIEAIPLMVWVILFGAIVLAVFVLRYATNWKVDVFGIVAAVVFGTILTYRAHWIDMGYAEAQAKVAQAEAKVKAAEDEVESYKETNLQIENCYAQSRLWDRTQGKCLSPAGD